MSRAHVQGFDSNAAQFDRMGNPWLTERERIGEVCGENNKERRRRRRLGKFPKVLVEAKRPDYDRSDSPAMREILRHRHFVSAFKSYCPGGTLDTVGVKPVPRETIIRPMRDAEPCRLTSEQLELRQSQRDAVQARLAAGEAAYAASEAAARAERRRLEAIVKGAQRRLAKISQ